MTRHVRRWGRLGAVLALTLMLGTSCQPVAGTALPLSSASMTVDQMPRITATELRQRIQAGETILIADTRQPASYLAERIKGAVNAPYAVEGQDYSQLPKDRFVALYCT